MIKQNKFSSNYYYFYKSRNKFKEQCPKQTMKLFKNGIAL
ncbi:hypothetical protein AsAng_0020010 [Aureispira anguillae]|uniref:Uncharacterized protein n=1 Tax=Aureispira anguillae TaxID=2864201 RepID=A0A916DQP4_9BACT|nr:hypothetical protein AsAng_0020010 [Aureispira anguillae]